MFFNSSVSYLYVFNITVKLKNFIKDCDINACNLFLVSIQSAYTVKHDNHTRYLKMANLTTTDISIIICFALFLVLLILGIVFTSVFAIAFSFIVGGIGYMLVDIEDTKQRVGAAEKWEQTKNESQ